MIGPEDDTVKSIFSGQALEDSSPKSKSRTSHAEKSEKPKTKTVMKPYVEVPKHNPNEDVASKPPKVKPKAKEKNEDKNWRKSMPPRKGRSEEDGEEPEAKSGKDKGRGPADQIEISDSEDEVDNPGRYFKGLKAIDPSPIRPEKRASERFPEKRIGPNSHVRFKENEPKGQKEILERLSKGSSLEQVAAAIENGEVTIDAKGLLDAVPKLLPLLARRSKNRRIPTRSWASGKAKGQGDAVPLEKVETVHVMNCTFLVPH
ncbi:hypothetical protein V5O48_018774 [Marasmius crinis-equi]|uniref:Uncharacterized protein n=1 Tax=Marasmius crinis-equi TaxID=585013 RepID=A0ABR3EKB8_9AGAR